jgi:hypothetical protein
MLLAVALVTAAIAVGAPASLARQETTSPAYNFSINVFITDKDVTLSASVAKRGWLVHFFVFNKTKHVVRFEVGGLKTHLIGPGKKGKVGAYVDTRGQYEYKVDNTVRGYFQVV